MGLLILFFSFLALDEKNQDQDQEGSTQNRKNRNYQQPHWAGRTQEPISQTALTLMQSLDSILQILHWHNILRRLEKAVLKKG